MIVSQKMAIQKYSWGPNFKPISAKGGERVNKAMVPKTPPNRELTALVIKACCRHSFLSQRIAVESKWQWLMVSRAY